MYIYQVERDLLRKGLQKYKGFLDGKVLDAGGGNGQRYRDLAQPSSEYLVLDINEAVKPDFVGSVESVPVNDNYFDSIICTQVLGDLLYPGNVIKEFKRILKLGGRIIITEGFMNEIHGEPNDFWRFTRYSLRSLLEDYGFSVKDVEVVGGFFSVITQMSIRLLINSLNLYRHKILGRLFSKLFWCLGKIAIYLDRTFFLRAGSKFGLDVIAIGELKQK